MAEPQYLFGEIPLSRAAFDRWLKSEFTIAEASGHTQKLQQQTIAQSFLTYLNAPSDELRFLLLHDKQQAVLRCGLWLVSDELSDHILHLVEILKTTASFVARNTTATVIYGENIAGTLIVEKDKSTLSDKVTRFDTPNWAQEWLQELEDASEDNIKKWIDSKLWNQTKRQYNIYLRNATPDNRIHIKNTDFFSNGTQVVSWENEVLPNANPFTFKRIFTDSLNNIYSDNNSVWLHPKLSLNMPILIDTNLLGKTIRLLEGDYDTDFILQIDNTLWFSVIENRQFKLGSITVDMATFQKINDSHYIDKNAFYGSNHQQGVFKIEGVDPRTVTKFDNIFSISGNQVFYYNGVLEHADAATFRQQENYYLDKKHVWEGTKLLEGFDPHSFEIVDWRLGLVKDANNVRICWKNIENADASTVELIDVYHGAYWRDKQHIWYFNQQLQPLTLPDDGELYFYPKSNFCRVGQNIWCQAHLLEGVDVETFTVIKPTIGRDKNYYYYEEHRYTHQEYAEKDVERYYTFG